MEQTNFKITSGSYKFVVSILEDKYMYKVRYGGKKACVNFSVYKEEDKEFPNLDGVGYSADCSIGDPLENSSGTQAMVKSALYFLVWRFPFIKHVQFIDASKKTCKLNISIDLATFHFAKHGKTWYQDKFDAQLINKNQQKYIDRAKVLLDSNHDKDFEGFWTKHILKHAGNIKKVHTEQLHDILEERWIF